MNRDRDAAIEAGARGVHERDRGVAWANGESHPTWDAASERLRSTARDRAAAVLDAVRWRPDAEVKAEALREAASEWQTGGWSDGLPPKRADRPALILGMAQRASGYLRARADRIERGEL